MSRWLIAAMVLAFATTVQEGPDEFACEVAVVCWGIWYGKRLWKRAENPMKVHPFNEVAARVEEILNGTYTGEHHLMMLGMVGRQAKVLVFQQFNCAACGTKQTMPDPNVLYTHGKCEECGAVTDIKRDGCNYAVHYMGRQTDA